MDFLAFLVVLCLAVWTWLLYLRSDSRPRRAGKLPPGPYPFPIIGNIFQLGKQPHQALAKLSQTYGPLMSLQLGSMYTVVVSSPEMAKEILLKHDLVFSSRTIVAAAHALDRHKISLVFLPVGTQWRKLRKICREQLFSAQPLDVSQGLRQENLERLYEYVQKCRDSGRAVNIGEVAFITMLNLMSATLFSTQLANFDVGASQEFKEAVDNVGRILAVANIADYFPIFKPFDPQGIKRKLAFYLRKLLSIIEDIINQRLESRRASLNHQRKNDLLETLLDLCEGSDYDLTPHEITHLFLDLIVAGTDTTSGTSEWILTELLLHPEKFSKVKHELRTVIGENKQVQESDLSRLPYFQAVIKEGFRYHPPAPILIPHKSESEVEVNGYVIPKGTQVIINVWALSRDPNAWHNPNDFEPERFLDRKTDFKGQDFELLPFGSGRRICPGMPLAIRMLPMLVATLIHNFDWKLEGRAQPKQVHRAELFGLSLHKEVPLKAIPIKP